MSATGRITQSPSPALCGASVVPERTRAAEVRVLVSILNWNTSSATVRCVEKLLCQILPADSAFEITVIDNGSTLASFDALQVGLPAAVTLQRNLVNLGFAGGHNLAIKRALLESFDYVWLLNSDATLADPATLDSLITIMRQDERCGAVSPTLANSNGTVYFSGASHDWTRFVSVWPSVSNSKSLELTHLADRWVSGAAVLLRSNALREVGLLNERYFAYYEDNEICARLSASGWHSRVAFDVCVEHPIPQDDASRPSYYFYLMRRNFLFFWFENTPALYRRLIWLRLLDQAFFECNKLYMQGHASHGKASLLGIRDFLLGRKGAPDLTSTLPICLIALQKLILVLQYRALRRHVAAEAAVRPGGNRIAPSS